MIKDIVLDPRNQRIRVLDYAGADLRILGEHLDLAAEKHGAGKVILYARESDLPELLSLGWQPEGVMAGFFQGQPAYCLTRYPDPQRAVSHFTQREDMIVRNLLDREARPNNDVSSDAAAGRGAEGGFTVQMLHETDVDKVMAIFAEVFATYPSPVENKTHFEQIFSGTGYLMMVARHKGQIAGIISAEIDENNMCAEITDCVTLPEFRGRGVMGRLLDVVEQRLWAQGLKYLYSLTRAGIPPINAVFHRRGYAYSGRLVNNCTIGGRFESMNIWEKQRS